MHFFSPSVSNTNSAVALYASLSIVDFRLTDLVMWSCLKCCFDMQDSLYLS